MKAGMFLLITACAGTPIVATTVTTTTTSSPTTTTTVATPQTLFSGGVEESPVVTPPEGSAAYLSPIGLVDGDGIRYLAVNGFDDDAGVRGVSLFEETEGAWTMAAGPIALDLDLEEPGPIGSSLVQGFDGTWFLHGWGSPLGEPESSLVWLATATDLFGEWTVQAEPVLVKGGTGEWDDEGVLFPSVVVTDEGFTMLYDGFGSLDGDHVGLAHSTDGVRWEKYNDLTTEGVFEERILYSVRIRMATSTPAAFRWGDW